VLLAAPTGSGQDAGRRVRDRLRAVRAGRRAIYTSPIKALSNQKFRDFKNDGLRRRPDDRRPDASIPMRRSSS
jgi:replicative superfamily II helicase